MNRWENENDYWADARCAECDRFLDRRGIFCTDCRRRRREDEIQDPGMKGWRTGD